MTNKPPAIPPDEHTRHNFRDEAWAERAAIIEYDAGFSREVAEKLATRDVKQRKDAKQ